MENATKALIIAGAILVSILLVTMGITLLGNTNGLTDSSKTQMSQLEVQEFNGQLEVGIGENVTGSNVKTMQEVYDAKKRDDPDIESILTITYTSPLTKDKVRSTSRYQVTATKDENTGMYKSITVSNKTAR